MKIIHLEASPGWGGQEMRSLNEAIGMRKRGHDICFVVMNNGGLIAKARSEGFKVYPLNFYKKNWIKAFFQLRRIFRDHEIDLVNTHSSLDAWIGGMAARSMKVPIIRTRHLSTPIRPGWNSRLLYGKLADYVVTTCQRIVEVICEQANISKDRCKSIPTGIRSETLDVQSHCSFRDDIGVKKEDFLVGMVCFMRSWKGVEDFLKAADLLRNEAGLKWTVIGGGHSKAYKEMAQELLLGDHVFFPGHLDNPFFAMMELDAFCLLSTAHEGVSQASLQAAFLEKPMVTTPTGGLCEVCIDQQTGILVPLFSPDKVAEAVLTLKKNPSLAKKMGSTGKKHVLEHFTFEKMLDQMETVYKKVVINEKNSAAS